MYKNVASQKFEIFAWNEVTGLPQIGDALNITAKVSRDGGVMTPLDDINPVEISALDAPGVYIFDASQAETNGDLLLLQGLSTTLGVQIDPVCIRTRPGTNLGYDVSAVGLSAIENQLWNAESSSHTTSGTFGKKIQDLVGGVLVIQGPIVAEPSGSLIVGPELRLSAFKGSSRVFVFAVVDANGAPVDLSGMTLKFIVETQTPEPEQIFEVTNITFDVSTVTVTITGEENNLDPGKYNWRLWNENEVLMHGTYTIIPASALS